MIRLGMFRSCQEEKWRRRSRSRRRGERLIKLRLIKLIDGLWFRINSVLCFFVVLLSSLCLPFSYPALIFAGTGEDFLNIRAKAAILVHADSGKILYAQNPDELLPTASMAKMMTEYLVLEAIGEQRVSWEQQVQISDYVYQISQNLNLSNVPLRRNQRYTVKELYEAMAIYSANGATIALAELIGGSEDNFVRMMNEKAAQLRLKDYNFVNSTGLNNSDLLGMHPANTGRNDEDMMSARATAKLAFHLLRDYPEVFQFSSVPKKNFREGTTDEISMANWNFMLPELIYGYEGMDGLKTGSTALAGYSFTGTAKREGVRYLTVVMKTSSIAARFTETRKLLDYGYANFSLQEVAPAGYREEGKSELPVANGRRLAVGIESNKPLMVLAKRGEEKFYKPVYRMNKTVLTEDGSLVAPVPKGKAVGLLVPEYGAPADTGTYEYLTDGETNEADSAREGVALVTVEDVEKAGFFTRIIRGIGRFFSGIFQGIFSLF